MKVGLELFLDVHRWSTPMGLGRDGGEDSQPLMRDEGGQASEHWAFAELILYHACPMPSI